MTQSCSCLNLLQLLKVLSLNWFGSLLALQPCYTWGVSLKTSAGVHIISIGKTIGSKAIQLAYGLSMVLLLKYYVDVSGYTYECKSLWWHKRASEPLELELQVVVGYPTWMLESELQSVIRARSALNC